MAIQILSESVNDVSGYSTVPISFEVRSRYAVTAVNDGFCLTEHPVKPYVKDYDALEQPSQWKDLFDTTNWVSFTAFDGGTRAGGAVVAYRTPGLEMLKGGDDVACLWDIRVRPEMRSSGVGKMLFKGVVEWCRTNAVRRLRIETQDINVPACRFYESRGCVLSEVNPNAYPAEMNETQLIWSLDL